MTVRASDVRGSTDRAGAAIAGPPLVVVWRVTERCDLGCRYCEYRRHLPRSRTSTDAATVLAFGALLRDLSALTGRTVHISFIGGEPLLWQPLPAVARTLKHTFGLQTGVTTNGTRLHEAGMLGHLADDYDQVTVSVDGLEAWHGHCRAAPGFWPRLRAGLSALAALKATRGRGPVLRANTVLMRSNVHELEALCCELATWGVETVTFNTLGGTPGDTFYDQEHLRPEHTDWLRGALPGMRTRLARLGLTLSGSDTYLSRLDHYAQSLPWPVEDCHPGAQFMFVDEWGRAGPCDATTAGYGVPVADLHSADDLLRLPRRLAERRSRQRLAPCADCRSTAVFGKFTEATA